jgi:hypothetical protein
MSHLSGDEPPPILGILFAIGMLGMVALVFWLAWRII